jgi:hypothetical protein
MEASWHAIVVATILTLFAAIVERRERKRVITRGVPCVVFDFHRAMTPWRGRLHYARKEPLGPAAESKVHRRADTLRAFTFNDPLTSKMVAIGGRAIYQR